MIRLFVGLELPADLRDHLSGLASGLPNARWTSPGNLHITLRFIGDIDEAQAELVHDSLSLLRDTAFDLVVRGCGAFASGHRTHTLWAGVEPVPPLLHLQSKVESAVVRTGLEPEGRRYRPHVTLARLRNTPTGRLQNFIAGNNLLRAEIRVERFVLFSSRLGQGEPVYTVLADYPLT
ncbi:MAG TPA: RNA 2',3'-cyclic phosphodiesterase [Patescibacteria group bacterium]|nr:RNA 2',3'-cyclic phosphodiesterase [Patescibacteria group bacterium]